MNDRPITEDDLNGFVDRALTPEREAEVVAYLREHPDVAKRVDGYAAQRDMLRAALAPVAAEPTPPEFHLAGMIERRRRQAPRWAAAAAAITLLVVGGAAGWSLRSLSQHPLEGVASLAQEAADSYAVYAPDRIRPVEIRASDRGALVDWASQRLGRPAVVPDLAANGYRFMGGRIVATAHGAAVLYMYDNDRGVRLVMLVRRMAADQNVSMAAHARGAVNGFVWAADGIGYSLVGAETPEMLHPIAEEARRQIAPDA